VSRAAPLLALVLCACGGGAGPGPTGGASDGGTCAAIGQLAYSSDGRWLAVAVADGRVSVFGLASGETRLLRVAASLPRVGLVEDGSLLLVAAEGIVRVWSAVTGQVVRTLDTGTGPSVSLKLSDSPTPDLLVSFDRSTLPADNVKVWRVSDGILVGLGTGGPLATFTHADAALLLLDQAGASFDVVSFGGRTLHHAVLPERLAPTAFAADGAYLGGVTGAGQLAVMAVDEDAFTWQAAAGTAETRQLVFLENPSRILQLGGKALLYDHTDGHLLRALPALDRARLAVASPDGADLAAVSVDGTIVLVSTVDGAARPLPYHVGCP
jgi:WD40 repeat protein